MLQALWRLAPNVIICDESHYLKNAKTTRTKTLMPLLKASKRCILLSGTPALSRPPTASAAARAAAPRGQPVAHAVGLPVLQLRRDVVCASGDHDRGGHV